MSKSPVKPQKENHKKSAIGKADGALWHHVTASVKPLRKSLKNRMPEVEASPVSQKIHEQKEKIPEPILIRSSEQPRQHSLPELSHGVHTGLDKSNAKKLRKGQHAIEAQLDLHGMTQQQAHVALTFFIEASFEARKRCVLVITGKGLKSDESVGVLRSAVPRWLNEDPDRSLVLAFSYATPKDGGEGALYVMLKRRR
jgi:DNA-nicking Smr family endonuclease